MIEQKRTEEKTNGLVVAIAMALCAAITLSRFVASFFPEKRLWGLSHLGYFPIPIRIVVTLAALAVFVPWINREIRRLFKPALVWVDGRLLKKPIGRIALGLFALIIFFLLRQKTFFLGDGLVLLGVLKTGLLSFKAPGLLGGVLPPALHRLLVPLHLPLGTSYVLLSCTAGLLFVWLALDWARMVAGRKSQGLWLAFGVLITMGIVQQFFGYVENYSLLLAAQLAYFIVSLRALEGRIPFIYTAFPLMLLISLHLTSLMLVPSWVLLWVQTRKGWSGTKKALIAATGILGAILAAEIFSTWAGKPHPLTRYTLPLTGGPWDAPGYALFSGAHFADLVNLHTIASPLLLPLIFLALWQLKESKLSNSRFWFLLSAALPQVGFTFFVNPILGAGRDWDMLSATGTLALTLLLTYTLVQIPSLVRGSVGVILVWTGFISTAGFVAVNASERASVRRAEDLAILDPLRDHGLQIKRLGNYFVALDQRQLWTQFMARVVHRVEGILARHKEFPSVLRLEKDPTSSSLAWYGLGEIYEVQEKTKEAISCYEQSAALHPEYVSPWIRLADLYRVTGQTEEEVRCLWVLTRLDPDQAGVWINLGAALEKTGAHQDAESSFRRAIRIDPKDPQAHGWLGNYFLDRGQWADAEGEFREAILLDPQSAKAYNNLGMALNRQSRYAEAEVNLRKGITLDPANPDLRFNLSIVLQRQGRNEEAEAEHEIYLKMEKEGKK